MSNREESKCPWCKEIMYDFGDYGLDDEESIETKCGKCDKDIMIQLHISYDYWVHKSGCSHHSLDMNEFYFLNPDLLEFKCTNCEKEFYDWQLPGGKHPKLKEGQFHFVGKAIKIARDKGLLK